jgi:cytochrome o ubiquinol oxidase subunit 2
MRVVKLMIGALAILVTACAIFFVLRDEKTLLLHPKGTIAQSELTLIATHYFLMFILVIPTYILFFVIAWKYRAKNTKAKRDPEQTGTVFGEVLLWIIPSTIIAVMIGITWFETHRLDPYRPLESEVEQMTIQVVALDWKWLFIYPEHNIATINFVQFPEKTPIHFALAADGSPMNSFWIPELSGQIYSMAGMITSLHLMADGAGEYAGRAAEINGQGFADMTFVAKSTSNEEFASWVREAKQSDLQLNDRTYEELLHSSINHPVTIYSQVDENLFDQIVMKYMYHHKS